MEVSRGNEIDYGEREKTEQQTKEIILVWKDEATQKCKEEFETVWLEILPVEEAGEKWDRLKKIVKEAAIRAGMIKVKTGSPGGQRKIHG